MRNLTDILKRGPLTIMFHPDLDIWGPKIRTGSVSELVVITLNISYEKTYIARYTIYSATV